MGIATRHEPLAANATEQGSTDEGAGHFTRSNLTFVAAAAIGAFVMGFLERPFLCAVAFLTYQLMFVRHFRGATSRELHNGPIRVVFREVVFLGKKDPHWLAATQWLGRCGTLGRRKPLLHHGNKRVVDKPPCTLGSVKDEMKGNEGVPELQGTKGAVMGETDAWLAQAPNSKDKDATLHILDGRMTQSCDARVAFDRTASCITISAAPDMIACGMAVIFGVFTIVWGIFAVAFTCYAVDIAPIGGFARKAGVLFMLAIMWTKSGLVQWAATALLQREQVEFSLKGDYKACKGDNSASLVLVARVATIKYAADASAEAQSRPMFQVLSGGKLIFGNSSWGCMDHTLEFLVEVVNAWLAEVQDITAMKTAAVLLSSAATDEAQQEPGCCMPSPLVMV